MIKKFTNFCLFFQFLPIILLALDNCDSPGPGYFKFMSKTVGRLSPTTPIKFEGKCFKKIEMFAKLTDKQIDVTILANDKLNKGCIEFILISSGRTTIHKFVLLHGSHETKFILSDLTQNELQFILENGFFVLKSCDVFGNMLTNLVMTVKLVIGGWGSNPHIPIFGSKIPQFQKNANKDFIHRYAGFQWNDRIDKTSLKIPKKSIKSGDLLFVSRFDGMDAIVQVNSGSRAGHVAMTFWEADQLYVIESKGGNVGKKHGIYRMEWEAWMKDNLEGENNVVLLPLKQSLYEAFDQKAAWEEFLKLEGNPYGFRNYMFSHIDTPDQNMTDMFDFTYFSIVLQFLEPFLGKQLDVLFYEGLNKRLGTENLRTKEIWEELYKRDISLGELSAIPEIDESVYSNGVNFVCSTFAIHLLNKGGLFKGYTINSTEFSPRDVYELNIFDIGSEFVPETCKNHSPRGYCQIMGENDFDLGKINFVGMYDHMNEKCPGVAPNFERTEKC